MNAGGLFIGPVICGFLINFTGTVPLYYYATPLFLILAMKIMNFTLIGPLQPVANESEKEEPSAEKIPIIILCLKSFSFINSLGIFIFLP